MAIVVYNTSMSKEIFDLKHLVGKSLLGAADKYLDTDQKVSDAQMAAFRKTLEVLPESKLKEFVSNLEGLQEVGAKTSEVYMNIQDHAWKLAKPFIVAGFPLAALIPDHPFSKITIKSTELSAKIAQKSIKASVQGVDKIKKKFKTKKG